MQQHGNESCMANSKGELYGIRKSLGMERNYVTAWK